MLQGFLDLSGGGSQVSSAPPCIIPLMRDWLMVLAMRQ